MSKTFFQTTLTTTLSARNMKLFRSAVIASILSMACAMASAQAVKLPVSAGWDQYPQLNRGKVILNYVESGKKLLLTYIVVGAEPNQTYSVGMDMFGRDCATVLSFGAPLFACGTYTREGTTAAIHVFPVGTLVTDANGDGDAHFNLDLSSAVSGSYQLQFWWARVGLSVHYRTGSSFGVGFGTVVVP